MIEINDFLGWVVVIASIAGYETHHVIKQLLLCDRKLRECNTKSPIDACIESCRSHVSLSKFPLMFVTFHFVSTRGAHGTWVHVGPLIESMGNHGDTGRSHGDPCCHGGTYMGPHAAWVLTGIQGDPSAYMAPHEVPARRGPCDKICVLHWK